MLSLKPQNSHKLIPYMVHDRHRLQQVYRAAERHLRKADQVMDRLIKLHGPCRLWEPSGTLFHSLASAIISQQLSNHAAFTIQCRVMKLTSNPLTPKRFLAVDQSDILSAGLSRAKAAYIRNLAVAVDQHGISKRKLQNLDDAQVLDQLTAIKGIGIWTAEMYLIFGLKRLDVVSLGDAGLQRAARHLYSNGEQQDDLLARVSEKWKPYRSVASWYLWAFLDNA